MAILLLARHGETEWNATHRWQGFAGPPLNKLGRQQAEELAERLARIDIDAIYSSDTIRVAETAEIVATRLGLDVRRDTRLREVNFGEWEGLTRQEINERYAGAFSEWDACKLALQRTGKPTCGWPNGSSKHYPRSREITSTRPSSWSRVAGR